jgi:hypothetical protein
VAVVAHTAEEAGYVGGGDLLHLLALDRGEVPIEVVALVFCGSLPDGSPSLPLREDLGEGPTSEGVGVGACAPTPTEPIS